VEVKTAVAKIGPVSGAQLETVTKAITQDLIGKLPQADRVYLEQMMYASYCPALRDDKTLSETEKATRIRTYNLEVRRTLQGPSRTKPQEKGSLTPLEARTELSKLSLPYTPAAFVGSASKGDALAVQLFLSAGMNPDEIVDTTNFNGTALMQASGNGDVVMVRMLLAAKADVNTKLWDTYSALGRAARSGKLDVARILLERGADPASIDEAFDMAAQHGQVELMRLLLQKGANVKKVGLAALAGAAAGALKGTSESAMVDSVKFLLDRGIDPNWRDDKGQSSLHRAAYDGFPAVVTTLLDRGADINARDNDGRTALWWSAGIRPDTAVILVDRGADLNVPDKDGKTALSRARYNNDAKLVEILLSRGAR
jgi:ankyrin repeat protein